MKEIHEALQDFLKDFPECTDNLEQDAGPLAAYLHFLPCINRQEMAKLLNGDLSANEVQKRLQALQQANQATSPKEVGK